MKIFKELADPKNFKYAVLQNPCFYLGAVLLAFSGIAAKIAITRKIGNINIPVSPDGVRLAYIAAIAGLGTCAGYFYTVRVRLDSLLNPVDLEKFKRDLDIEEEYKIKNYADELKRKLAAQRKMGKNELAAQREEITESLTQHADKCKKEFSAGLSNREQQFKERIERLEQEALEYKEKSPEIYKKMMQSIEDEKKFFYDLKSKVTANLFKRIDFIVRRAF